MNRTLTATQKVQTRFGSLYVHVSHVGGRVIEVRFSSPGKFSDTTMGEVFDALGDAVNSIIAELPQCKLEVCAP